MNSGTPASVAAPDRSSLGMMMSTSTRTVAYSCAVKNFGLKATGLPVVAPFHTCARRGTQQVQHRSAREFLRHLDAPCLALLGDVLAGAHRERENRPRAVLVRL